MMNIAGMEEPSLSSVSNRGQDQAEMVPTSPADLDVKGAAQTANKAILDYLTHHSEEFRVLGDLQRKGWSNPAGDTFFQKQRRKADACSSKDARFFYKMMQNIGAELQESTSAFDLPMAHDKRRRILDMCVAPGGFLRTALRYNPDAQVVAFSLPVFQGGHRVLLPRDLGIKSRFLDVTMLAEDMGVGNIPPDHPDVHNFQRRQFQSDELFDLAICDGQVLRTHNRAPYREKREASRLISTQLALSLEHLRPGGTMVVLLHKLSYYDTAFLIWRFTKFSTVRLFKPTRAHRMRSSFYMIASSVQSRDHEASSLIGNLKTCWRLATFSSEMDYIQEMQGDQAFVGELLEEFGPSLVEMGREIWKIQAEALGKASFTQG